jgi:type III pantothenate kinase
LTSLSIDIGNTRIKAGVFENGKLQTVFKFEDLEGLKLYTSELPSEMPIIISSVTNDNLTAFHQYFKQLILLNHHTPIPISNLYATPETLGKDRLAAVVGAASMYQKRNALVIDVGTCIKYDLVNENAEYHGGQISPGVEMKFKALHLFTDRLPEIKPQAVFENIGNDTEHAILGGVMMGTLMEMQGFIDAYSEQNKDLIVILTGGDHTLFVNRLKGTIFAEPELILNGLFEILKYNAPGV